MECKLILFSILVLCSVLADCFPQIAEDSLAYQAADWRNTQRLPQHNVNYVNYQPFNVQDGSQNIPSELWSKTQRSPQYPLNSNFARPPVVDKAPNDYLDKLPQVLRNQGLSQQHNELSQNSYKSLNKFQEASTEIRPNDVNNFARSPNVFNEPQSYDDVKSGLQPSDINNPAMPQNLKYWPLITSEGPQQIPAFQSVSDIRSEGWWNGQRLPNQQQGHIFEKPRAPDTFVNSYSYPTNQKQQRYRNYDQGNSQYQTTVPMISNPVDSFNNYGQGWPPQNQYHSVSVPNLVEYLPWPVPDSQNMPPNDQGQTEPMNNEYNRSAVAAYIPVAEEITPTPNVKPTKADPELVYQNDHKQIVSSQQLIKDQNAFYHKRYIIVHANGTYEHVDHLDDIVVDEFNVAHIKSKDETNPVLAIFEIKNKIIEKEYQKPLELPYDTGISKIPQDTDWNSNYEEHPSMLQKTYPISWNTQLHEPVSDIPMTTEDPTSYIMNYFQPEYTMPIEFTTANSINNGSYTSQQPTETNRNTNTNENNFAHLYTPQINEVPQWVQHFKEGDENYFKPENIIPTQSTSANDSANNKQTYYEPGGTTRVEMTPSQTPKPRIENNGHLSFSAHGDDHVPDSVPKSKPSLAPGTSKDSENVTDNAAIEEKTTFPTKNDKVEETTPKCDGTSTNAPSTREHRKLREDLEIDPGTLKTVIDKPLVWFRPDDNFWNKVTKGDQAYDALSLYNVQCQPKLIERLTTINHYPNGTEVVDYVETIWDSPSDLNPKEVTTNRVVRDSP